MVDPSTRLPGYDAAADLFLGGRCVGCGRPGRLLCRDCRASLVADPWPAWPTPTPAGLVPPWAAVPYAGVVRAAVLGHKEHGLLALARPLGLLLAHAVQAAAGGAGPLLLVPVPSRRSTVRARGHEPTRALVVAATRHLRRAGHDAHAVRLLAVRGPVADQAGLDMGARAANLAGSFRCPTELLTRAATRHPRGRVLVCDDVLTTGATAREAQRALAASGVRAVAVATVAATVRRRLPIHTESSGWSLAKTHPTD